MSFLFFLQYFGKFSLVGKTNVSSKKCYLLFFDELRSLFPFAFLCVYFTKISLDSNGFFRVQAMREVELQIHTSYKKETCFSHF